jgi:hypothetical protein
MSAKQEQKFKDRLQQAKPSKGLIVNHVEGIKRENRSEKILAGGLAIERAQD